jgi:hypothetical protein
LIFDFEAMPEKKVRKRSSPTSALVVAAPGVQVAVHVRPFNNMEKEDAAVAVGASGDDEHD